MLFKLTTLLLTLSLYLIPFVSSRAGYDQSSGQFDPTGRVLQLEYAKEAVRRKGNPIVAIRCSDGIILVAARNSNNNDYKKKSLEITSPQKFFFIDNHVCIGVTGLLFESRAILTYAKKVSAEYKSRYGSSIPIENLSDELANVLHRFTLESTGRPLAVNLVVAGYDEILGFQIYTVDPEGSFSGWNSVGLGKNNNNIMEILSNCFNNDNNNNNDNDNNNNNNSAQKNMESVWPLLKKNVLNDYIRDKVNLGNFDDCEFEGYTCMLNSQNEITWSIIDNEEFYDNNN